MKFAPLLMSPKKARTPRARRMRRWVMALALYSITGFLIAPAILKWQLVKQLPKFTRRQAAIRQVRMNPFALSLTIRGLALTETNGEPFAAFDEFYANFQLSSLFRWAWTFGEISLKHPTANVVRGADGQFNFVNLLSASNNTPVAEPKPSLTLPRVLVQRLVVTNGVVTFTDRTRATPFRAEYGPTDLNLKDFTTRRQKDSPYVFIATTGDGESFAWSGTVSVNPPQSTGAFKLAGIPLRKYSPYLAEFTTAQIFRGTLAIDASYRLNASAAPLKLDVTNAGVQLDDFKIQAPEGDTVLTITNLFVTNASASLGGREARVPLVALSGGTALARREADGKLNLLKLLVAQTNAVTRSATNEASSGQAAAWKLFVDEFDLKGFAVTVQDRTPPEPMELGLDDLRVNLKGFSTESNTPLNVTLAFKGRAGGSAQVEANGTLLPLAIDAKVSAADLPLKPMQPYAEQFTHLVIQSGVVTSEGRLRYAPNATKGPMMRFDSDLEVTGFQLNETLSSQELVRWDTHSIRGIQVEIGQGFNPQRVKINEIKFKGLNAGVTILSNGQPNVFALVKPPPAGTPATSTLQSEANAAAKPMEFPIEVGSFVLDHCSLHATDFSVKPRFNTSVEQIDGTFRDLKWPKPGRTVIDLAGKISALAPFSIKGAVTPDPKQLFVDLALAFKNSDLTPLSPYSEKFVGHPLNKGKLTFDLRYQIENRALNASNVLAIDQLTLGPRGTSTNATKLPVRLAVALLKDRDGRINLDLPVTGSLDDPKFSIGGVILKVFVNLLVKVATSPFALLGAMFGGGEELQYVDFAPGSAVISDAQTNKLGKLTKALFERPALNLEISASVDPLADREVVSKQKLKDSIKKMRIEELSRRGKPTPTLSELELEDGDYDRLLRKAYKDAFNTTPEKALRDVQAAAAITNAADRSPALPGGSSAVQVQKGGVLLVQGVGAKASKIEDSKAGTDGKAPTRPKTEGELIRDELERRLATTVMATDDDLRDLMQRRAQAVQRFLLDSGRVTAERLFHIAPKPFDPDAKGLPRVVFSLN